MTDLRKELQKISGTDDPLLAASFPSGDAPRSEPSDAVKAAEASWLAGAKSVTTCPTCGAPVTMPTKSTSNGLTGPALVTQGMDTYRYAPTQESREAAAWQWCVANDEWPRHWPSGYFLESSASAANGGGYRYFDSPLEAVEAAREAAIQRQSPTGSKEKP